MEEEDEAPTSSEDKNKSESQLTHNSIWVEKSYVELPLR